MGDGLVGISRGGKCMGVGFCGNLGSGQLDRHRLRRGDGGNPMNSIQEAQSHPSKTEPKIFQRLEGRLIPSVHKHRYNILDIE